MCAGAALKREADVGVFASKLTFKNGDNFSSGGPVADSVVLLAARKPATV